MQVTGHNRIKRDRQEVALLAYTHSLLVSLLISVILGEGEGVREKERQRERHTCTRCASAGGIQQP